MARVNIEDSLYRDVRFSKLQVALGSRRMALGALVEAWSVAQMEHSLDNRAALIPIERWREQECADEILQCGLAVLEGDMIYMRGAETQFNWLTKSKLNGKLGGRPKEPTGIPRGTQRVPAETRTQPSSLLCSTPLYSSQEQGESPSPAAPPPLPRLAMIWNEHRGKLPAVKLTNPTRSKRCAQRWRERSDEGYWVTVVQRVAASAFCNGKNDRGWRADFDFLLQPETHLKATEGKYDTVRLADEVDLSHINWSGT